MSFFKKYMGDNTEDTIKFEMSFKVLCGTLLQGKWGPKQFDYVLQEYCKCMHESTFQAVKAS